jgi:alpha-tubulin suppressor-like RCC1 family protein
MQGARLTFGMLLSCAGLWGIFGCSSEGPAGPQEADAAPQVDAAADASDAGRDTGDLADAGVSDALPEPCGITGLRVGGQASALRERSGAFPLTLSLQGRPQAQVTLRAELSPARARAVPEQISFQPDTWSLGQAVVVSGIDNGVADATDKVTLRFVTLSTDPCFDKLSVDVPLTVADDYATALLLRTPSFMRTTWSAGTIAVGVRLGAKPQASVTVPLMLSDTAEATADKTQLTFGPGDFDKEQVVTLVGKPSTKPNYKNPVVLSLGPSSSSDQRFAQLTEKATFENVNPNAVDQLAGNGQSSCAVFADGRVKCWGAPIFPNDPSRGTAPGQMGVNLPFRDFGPDFRVREVGVAGDAACAVDYEGRGRCFGGRYQSASGALGSPGTHKDYYNTGTGDSIPLKLGGSRIHQISQGSAGSFCAIVDGGALKCWGSNVAGELGLGDRVSRGALPGQMGASLPAVDLGAGRTVKAVASGRTHRCALLDNSGVKCWGGNGSGVLGLGDASPRGGSPGEMGDNLPYVNLGNVKVVALASAGEHTCALDDTGKVKCWGYGPALGLGDAISRGASPAQMGDALPFVDLGPGRTAVELSGGAYNTCARLDDGSIKCWGGMFSPEDLGLGSATPRGNLPNQMGANLPVVDLGTGPKPVAFASGAARGVVRADGSIKMWGRATGLGLGDTNNRGDQPGEMGDALPVVPLLSP